MNPQGLKGVFVVFRAYSDESYDKNLKLLCVSSIIGDGAQWLRLVRDWKSCLDRVNSRLDKQGRHQISRYHAADCSARKGEFDGWSKDEQRDFVCELFEIMRASHLHAVSLTVDLKRLRELYPTSQCERLAHCFLLLPLLHKTGEEAQKMHPSRRISFFHDRTAYDHVLSQMFWGIKDHPKSKYGSRFVTIAPLAWSDCIALQPADLFAYEGQKEMERRLHSDRPIPRKSFTLLRGSFPRVPWIHAHMGPKQLAIIEKKISVEMESVMEEGT